MSKIKAPFQLLELNVISAQDLAPVTRSLRTYAVAWVHPERKLTTRVDAHGHTNPTWNDKFVFRVDEEFLYADTSAIMIEIYALHWFKDVHVGTVRVLVDNLIPPPSRPFHNTHAPMGMRFVALQVRRPSGRPQGILNVGVAVLDSSMRSMPLYTSNASAVGYRDLMGEMDANDKQHNHLHPQQPQPQPQPQAQRSGKPELRRTKSDTSSMISADIFARRARGKTGKARSAITSSEDSVKDKKKGRSKGSSVVSDSGFKWKANSGIGYSSSSTPSNSELNQPMKKGIFGKPSPYIYNSPMVQPPNKNGKISVNATPIHNILSPHKNKVFNKPESSVGHSSTTNDSAEGFAAPEIHKFVTSPRPQYLNSPAAQIGSRKGTPRGTPLHPADPNFNQPVGFGGSIKGTPRNTPLNLGASIKGTPRTTPLHHYGKVNPSLEYGTPRRSNLGFVNPPILTESELGPSPSEVAAAMAKAPPIEESENSTVGGWSVDESVEGLQSKLERWQTKLPPLYDFGEFLSFPASSTKNTKTTKASHSRRHTDGGSGLFSCFSNICGCECSIVCGGGSRKEGNRRRTPSADNVSFL